MTFHQRAAALKTLAAQLLGDKEEFYALSRRTGATDRDTAVDVDGGFGAAPAYASRARRELPDDTVLVDGEVEQLGKQGTFVARHIYTPLRGVAVQINAFNFPVWGFLEKYAPAFLAGVPSIVKPAGSTAHLTEAVVRRIVDSGVAPDGALQLLAGSAGGVLDQLSGQELVFFTGSADTARTLRSHPSVLGKAVRFNAEADSLNCSVLGSDGNPETPESGLFVDQLVTEMTVKAGQKCTAIRRALVPQELLDDVVEATRHKLDGVVVGARCPTTGSATPWSWRPGARAASSAPWSPTTPTWPAPSSVGPHSPTDGSLCSTGTPRRRAQATGSRCRCWCTAVRGGPVAGRSSVACAASSGSCSAPLCRRRRRCWPASARATERMTATQSGKDR
jgi:phenylacetic acid degradation protein PaaN